MRFAEFWWTRWNRSVQYTLFMAYPRKRSQGEKGLVNQGTTSMLYYRDFVHPEYTRGLLRWLLICGWEMRWWREGSCTMKVFLVMRGLLILSTPPSWLSNIGTHVARRRPRRLTEPPSTEEDGLNAVTCHIQGSWELSFPTWGFLPGFSLNSTPLSEKRQWRVELIAART